jgi:hypothetical protein
MQRITKFCDQRGARNCIWACDLANPSPRRTEPGEPPAPGPRKQRQQKKRDGHQPFSIFASWPNPWRTSEQWIRRLAEGAGLGERVEFRSDSLSAAICGGATGSGRPGARFEKAL